MNYYPVYESDFELILKKEKAARITAWLLLVISVPFLVFSPLLLLGSADPSLLIFPSIGFVFISGALVMFRGMRVYPDRIIVSGKEKAVLIEAGRSRYSLPFAAVRSVEKKYFPGNNLFIFLRLKNGAILDIASRRSLKQKWLSELHEKLSIIINPHLTESASHRGQNIASDLNSPDQNRIFFYKNRTPLFAHLLYILLIFSFGVGAYSSGEIMGYIFSAAAGFLAVWLLVNAVRQGSRGYAVRFSPEKIESGWASSKESAGSGKIFAKTVISRKDLKEIVYSLDAVNGLAELILLARNEDIEFLEKLRDPDFSIQNIGKMILRQFRSTSIHMSGYNAAELFGIAEEMNRYREATER